MKRTAVLALIVSLLVVLPTLSIGEHAQAANYPALSVAEVYFGDETGQELPLMPGSNVYVWVRIVNSGDGDAQFFTVDFFMGQPFRCH